MPKCKWIHLRDDPGWNGPPLVWASSNFENTGEISITTMCKHIQPPGRSYCNALITVLEATEQSLLSTSSVRLTAQRIEATRILQTRIRICERLGNPSFSDTHRRRTPARLPATLLGNF